MTYWLLVSAVNGLVAVAAGAFGAHALKDRLPAPDLAIFETGARYQMYHALALLAVAWLADRAPSPLVTAAGWAFTIGCVIFSGSLYALTLSGLRWLGAITPIGGVGLMLGWLLLAAAAIRMTR
ncbi:MAG: DUF423 domain-containing protein [Phycisphaerae bacterium]|nr:DUF423 domain-containing protein [Phycisphaerae bacterium]